MRSPASQHMCCDYSSSSESTDSFTEGLFVPAWLDYSELPRDHWSKKAFNLEFSVPPSKFGAGCMCVSQEQRVTNGELGKNSNQAGCWQFKGTWLIPPWLSFRLTLQSLWPITMLTKNSDHLSFLTLPVISSQSLSLSHPSPFLEVWVLLSSEHRRYGSCCLRLLLAFPEQLLLVPGHSLK